MSNDKQQSGLEWLIGELIKAEYIPTDSSIMNWVIAQAKLKERNQNAIYQLFIGKISELIGFEKTAKILKECKDSIKSQSFNTDTL